MSISEIASRENINKSQLQNWKREFTENSARVFAQSKIEKESEKKVKEVEGREHALMAKVGQLTIEVESPFPEEEYVKPSALIFGEWLDT